MKHWTEQDLILFYYQELEAPLESELKLALTQSAELQQRYAQLCHLLDEQLELVVPEPSADLNQRIMAGIKRSQALRSDTTSAQHSTAQPWWRGLMEWLGAGPNSGFALASFVALCVVASTFYLGRLTAPVESPTLAQQEQAYYLDQQASRRILLSQVSTHMQTGQRLLTRVSNGEPGLADEFEARQQMVDDLVAFNRMYRRVAEQSNDAMLASVLTQMESLLIELRHTGGQTGEEPFKQIQQRLIETDLLFKLRVTDAKISQEII